MITKVCKECRAIACRTGRLVPIRNAMVFTIMDPENSQSRIPAAAKTQWSWFDPARDTLHLKADWLRSPVISGDLFRLVESITIEMAPLPLTYNLPALFSPQRFPRLVDINLVEASTKLPEWSDPHIEGEPFGSERSSPMVIDADDPTAYGAVLHKLQKTKHKYVKNAGRIEPHSLEWVLDDVDRSVVKWPAYKNFLRRVWATGQRRCHAKRGLIFVVWLPGCQLFEGSIYLP